MAAPVSIFTRSAPRHSGRTLGERRRMTLYLVRHAQCLPKKSQPFSDWSLSRAGARQADELAGLLDPLEIVNVFSSPFVRTIETARPFAQRHGLLIRVVDDLRERLLTNEAGLPSDEVWRRSWEDFSFRLPGCESSHAAQARICQVIRSIAQSVKGTSAIFTHGNVIPLFLKALTLTTRKHRPSRKHQRPTRRVERTGGSRRAQTQIGRQWRLPPVAHPDRWVIPLL